MIPEGSPAARCRSVSDFPHEFVATKVRNSNHSQTRTWTISSSIATSTLMSSLSTTFEMCRRTFPTPITSWDRRRSSSSRRPQNDVRRFPSLLFACNLSNRKWRHLAAKMACRPARSCSCCRRSSCRWRASGGRRESFGLKQSGRVEAHDLALDLSAFGVFLLICIIYLIFVKRKERMILKESKQCPIP